MEQLHLFMASSKSANEQAEVINIVCWIIDVIDGVEVASYLHYIPFLSVLMLMRSDASCVFVVCGCDQAPAGASGGSAERV
jgi:hypothetical protein